MIKAYLDSIRANIACLAAISLLAASPLQAQEQPPTSVTAETAQEISPPRKIAGLGVLAFLIGWMFWRNHQHNKREQKHSEHISQ